MSTADVYAVAPHIGRGGWTPEAMDIYKVEPYVVTADVYAAPAHVGRGGWSWYTGSAGWMYRLMVESLLGLRIEGAHLCIAPVLPAAWQSFKLDYRHAETDYHITVTRAPAGEGGDQVSLDGEAQVGQCILLTDDGRDHYIDVQCR